MTATSQGAAGPPRLRPGWHAVARKELADHLLSVRFTVLLILLGLVAVATVYSAASSIRDAAPEVSGAPALFLGLFVVGPEQFLTFMSLVGFLAPLLGIAFGFDAVNGERAQGTLPRLLAQPIHRDDVINGKFVAALIVIGLVLSSLILLVAGIGIFRLGITPSGEEIARMALWLVVLLTYVAFWQGLATLCSVALRRAATSALACIAAWLVLTLFWATLVSVAAGALAPVGDQPTPEQAIRNSQIQTWAGRISPTGLYTEATIALLAPEAPNNQLVQFGFFRAIPSVLPVDQTLLTVWPQIVGLIALTLIFFAIAYVAFMRQEVRA